MANEDRSGVRARRKSSGSFSIIESQVPVAGVDYPESLEDLARLYPNERAARRFIEYLRFPTGFVCQGCGQRGEPWRSGTGLLACQQCRHPSPVIEGSLFEGSTIPLTRWLRILWEATDSEGGITTQSLTELLRADQAAAQHTLQRIRALMATPGAAPLSDHVQVGIARFELADPTQRPVIALMLGAVGRGRRRVRLRALDTVSAREVVRFVVDHAHEGSTVHTTSWRGFNRIGHAGYAHKRAANLPYDVDMQRVQSMLKLWMWSNQDVSLHNLGGCLDDFAFRYNRREYPKGLLFFRLMILATSASLADRGETARTA